LSAQIPSDSPNRIRAAGHFSGSDQFGLPGSARRTDSAANASTARNRQPLGWSAYRTRWSRISVLIRRQHMESCIEPGVYCVVDASVHSVGRVQFALKKNLLRAPIAIQTSSFLYQGRAQVQERNQAVGLRGPERALVPFSRTPHPGGAFRCGGCAEHYYGGAPNSPFAG
jgi:hypothetical protein